MKKISVFLCICMMVAFCSCGLSNDESAISKNEAAEQLLQFIYSDNPDIIQTFSFSDSDRLWGYEGNKRDYSEDSYQTMILEFVKDSGNQESYVFWFHERHYSNEEFDHDVTSNFYAINRETGQIVPERVYLSNGTYKINDEYRNSFE